MKIGIRYYDYCEEGLTDPYYMRVLKHEIIHVKLNSLLKKHMMPIIDIIPHEEEDYTWYEGKCKYNFIFKQISLFLFIKILISTFADSLFDLITYLIEHHKNNNISEMLIKNSIFVGFYFLRALNIIRIKENVKE